MQIKVTLEQIAAVPVTGLADVVALADIAIAQLAEDFDFDVPLSALIRAARQLVPDIDLLSKASNAELLAAE